MLAGLFIAIGLLVGAAATQLPSVGAGALLHPGRRPVTGPTPAGCIDHTFAGDRVQLRGWRCAATTPRRGTIVYLHGVADNRAGAEGVAARFGPRGFDVVAYDSRAHGASDGEACTYGFYEKHDLARVIDTLEGGPIVLVGSSLGAAVALQAAAVDRRITVDDVSPASAAASIAIPVFLVHGDADRETPPAHSRRVFDALAGPRHLELVPGAGHNQSLRPHVWDAIARWLDVVLPVT